MELNWKHCRSFQRLMSWRLNYSQLSAKDDFHMPCLHCQYQCIHTVYQCTQCELYSLISKRSFSFALPTFWIQSSLTESMRWNYLLCVQIVYQMHVHPVNLCSSLFQFCCVLVLVLFKSLSTAMSSAYLSYSFQGYLPRPLSPGRQRPLHTQT